MKFAIYQMEIRLEDIVHNVSKAEKAIRSAAKSKADIILFPEMSFTGFSMNVNNTQDTKGKVMSKIQNYAIRYSINIGFGWVNKNNELAENHYSIINSSGTVVLDYIKMHPFSFADESKYFLPGNEVKYCKINHIKMSSFICYDLRFPEIFQVASQVASVIIVAANWPAKRTEHWKCLLKARAIENQVYMIGINCTGSQGETYYTGSSCVINPNGDIIYEISDGEELFICDINDDVSMYQNNFPTKKDRRSNLYKELL